MNKTLLVLIICVMAFGGLVGCQKATISSPTPAAEASATTAPATEVVAVPTLPKAADTATTAAANPTATQAGNPVASPTTEVVAPTVPPTDVPATTAVQPTNPAATDIPAAAVVNGQAIPLADYQAQVDLAEASYTRQAGSGMSASEKEAALAQVRRQVLDWMIDQVLIEQAAARLRITIPDEQVNAELAKAKGSDATAFAKWLQDNSMTEESFKAALRSELLGTEVRNAVTNYLPTEMEQVHLRHILVATREEAESILSQIKTNDDFVRLCKQYSLDLGTRDNGGDLGFYPRDVLSPEIDRVAFNMVTGQISDVIQTSYGFHIIQVLERAAVRPVPESMMIALRQQAFMDWLTAERAKAQIDILVQ